MSAALRTRRPHWALAIVLAYALVALLVPALHSDDCLRATPAHCAACQASPVASAAVYAVALLHAPLAPSDPVAIAVDACPDLALALDTPGRAPPA